MSEYRLQTDLSDETKREMVLQSEKRALQTEIQNHREKIAKRFYNSTKAFSLIILLNVILSFAGQRPTDFFVVIIYGVGVLIELVWLLFGLQKRRRKLEEWQIIFDEKEFQHYGNQ